MWRINARVQHIIIECVFLNNARFKTDLPKDIKQSLNTKSGAENTVNFLKEPINFLNGNSKHT